MSNGLTKLGSRGIGHKKLLQGGGVAPDLVSPIILFLSSFPTNTEISRHSLLDGVVTAGAACAGYPGIRPMARRMVPPARRAFAICEASFLWRPGTACLPPALPSNYEVLLDYMRF